MIAAMTAPFKGVPVRGRVPVWTVPDWLLGWIIGVRARTGPTTAGNGDGPRVTPHCGVEVFPSPRHLVPTLSWRVSVPWQV